MLRLTFETPKHSQRLNVFPILRCNLLFSSVKHRPVCSASLACPVILVVHMYSVSVVQCYHCPCVLGLKCLFSKVPAVLDIISVSYIQCSAIINVKLCKANCINCNARIVFPYQMFHFIILHSAIVVALAWLAHALPQIMWAIIISQLLKVLHIASTKSSPSTYQNIPKLPHKQLFIQALLSNISTEHTHTLSK